MRKKRQPSKYLRYEQARNYISNFSFKTLKDYTTYVKSRSIDYLPLHPKAQYSEIKFNTWEFLGLEESVYKANLLEQRRKQASEARCLRTAESFRKIGETRRKNLLLNSNPDAKVTSSNSRTTVVVKSSEKGLDPDKVIQFLIQEEVEPEVIVKMIADLDIRSGTLMAELCKYMTKKSLEKQASWRPSGYNTSEAQLSIKI